MTDSYRSGGHWVIDDRTGARIRASDAVTEWNGAVVHRDDAEPRHPQDFVRANPDRQNVGPPIRNEPVPVLVGPLITAVTAAASAGGRNLSVESSVRFATGDDVVVMLDNGDTFRTKVQSAPDATSLSLLDALPWSTSPGNAVVNQTAVSGADIG